MPMMHVRYMRMRVLHPAVFMKMRMWFSGRINSTMGVLMMLIMHVRVRMRRLVMNMLMLVVLG